MSYTPGMDRLEAPASLLLIVDVQERLAAAIPRSEIDRLTRNVLLLVESAALLGVPVVTTEQYPKGLGPTIAPIGDRVRALGVEPIDKVTFDACGEARVLRSIADRAPRAVVVAGVETHVCVFQTARELFRRGYAVHVVADAVASRRDDHRVLGLALCERAGAYATPAESVVFDWLGRAGTDEFRVVSKLLR